MGGYTGVGQLFTNNDPNYNNFSQDASGPWSRGTSGLYPTPVAGYGNQFPTTPVVPSVPTVPNVGSAVAPTAGGNPFSVPITGSPYQHGTETGSTYVTQQGGRDVFRTADGRLMKDGVYLTDTNGQYLPNKGYVGSVAGTDRIAGGNNMGSTLVPTSPMNPNMGSLTGNPIYDKETMNNLSTIVPGSPTGQFGNVGKGSPLAPNPAPMAPAPFSPMAPVAAPPSTTPQGGNPNVYTNPVATPGAQPATMFGYSTAAPTTAGAGAVPGAIAAQLPKPDPALVSSLDKTYGAGFGNSINNLLTQGMGYNQDVVNAFQRDIQPYFNDNLNQILESFGASGQRFSSTAALAAGKFGADFTSHQQALMAQMYQWAFDSYTKVLTGTGSKNTEGNTFGTIADVLSLVKSGANATQSGGVGNKGGVLGGILDALSHI